MHCIVAIILLTFIACLVISLLIHKNSGVKQRGGYAAISDSGYGTIITFERVMHKPLVIRLANPSDHLDLVRLTNVITTNKAFPAAIKKAVKNPCKILDNPSLASGSIYSAVNTKKLYSTLFKTVGNCDMDMILHTLHENDETLEAFKTKLAKLRNDIITIMTTNADRFIIDEMNNVSQGDSKGNSTGPRYLYIYGNQERDPMLSYPYLIDDYTKLKITKPNKNGIMQPSYVDPFSNNVFKNNDLRGWYGKDQATYKKMNPQYVRPGEVKVKWLDDTGKFNVATKAALGNSVPLNAEYYRLLTRVEPDEGKSKETTDDMADIIPAGSVRQTIMLYLEHILFDFTLKEDATFNIVNQGADKLPELHMSSDDILSHISYMVLLTGLANSFANTTHYHDYNSGIEDRYRYNDPI